MAQFRQNRQKWRKCMGIEPTGHTVNVQPNGFEDRGHHQVCKHFRYTLQVIKLAPFTGPTRAILTLVSPKPDS